jgi:hypothetical protein
MSATALNVDRISPGDVLDTKSRAILHLAKNVVIVGSVLHTVPAFGSWVDRIL